MSSLRDNYDRVTYADSAKSLAEKAAKYNSLFKMINSWTIPANSSVYISALTPPASAGRGGTIGRTLDAIISSGIKYTIWHGATSIVYDPQPTPDRVTPGSLVNWRKITSLDLNGATLIDEFWLPDGSNAGGGSGSFEEIEEITMQPNDTEIILQLENLSLVNAYEVLLKITYIEDTKNLIFSPWGTQ